MSATSPLDILRDLAQRSLDDAATRLGKMRQAHREAVSQHDTLLKYQAEYRDYLQRAASGEGISVINLMNYGAFIHALGNAVEQHRSHVAACQAAVDRALSAWRQDKQRFNAFCSLKMRADAALMLQQNRQEQKMMDEYAQRASLRKEK
ncbi:flagellar export protein FliJ [[Erwinia] mediterraneensis]|uniref:flagellar export protein FliJ n=1 Tax=[Erwinia] mediterraneensis TaxID=2161819 RepID=UPI001031968C|nr:flagellar export protein FliJ [[Erwinia] mediterraneensis]